LINFEVEQHEDTFPAMPPGAALSETVDLPAHDGEYEFMPGSGSKSRERVRS
jgi:hypothetical protein